eukprot:TRINITY_DN33935_c0_g1_i1.p1 TRINITY_DN33935_c0_g1~~TRINITY_DN33935_c0_g1_i1.p1  ORF type:complete len:1294 (+),score=285.07 TRINITY_DN33935_c0_g1_i1:60-3941(+)
MGNQLTMGVDMNPADILEGLKPKAPLGGGKGRLLKSLHCTSEDGDVVCKMFLKTNEADDHMLDNHARRLARCELSLKEQKRRNPDKPSNVCFYTLYKNVPSSRSEMKAAFVVRTFFKHSLQERIMTRPFLTTETKLWLSYQLLRAVDEMHAAHVPHGDLKVANVMVTSLGWLYVTDMAPFKPSHLSNPADFSYFFDTAENRHCTLAPERFVMEEHLLTEKLTEPVTERMDVFGAGCAIAQLFLGGEVLFKLDQLLAYKKGEYDASERLKEKIDDPTTVDMIMLMLERDPAKRPTALQVIEKYTNTVFPKYYSEFHGNVIGPLVALSPDKRIASLNSRLPEIIEYVKSGCETEAEEKEVVRGAVIILATVLCGTIRHCLISGNKVVCLQAMMTISPYAGDDCNLHTLLSYAITMARDRSPLVRATAVKTVAKTVQNIESFPPGEASLFDDYIVPAITPLATDRSVLVKATLAENLPEIAFHARRFLETRQLLPQAETSVPFNEGYDSDLKRLQDLFEELVRLLVMGGEVSPWITRGFLSDITKFCVFFGRQRTNNFIIPTLTISVLFLNAPDFQVRRDLHKQLVGIAVYVGPTFLSYILPCIKEGLMDIEEIVVHEALNSLSKLSSLGMLDRKALVDLSEVVVPLLLHPSNWIRSGALEFFSSMDGQLSQVDTICFVLPMIKPFLKYTIPDLKKETLEAALIPPITRTAFDNAIKDGSANTIMETIASSPRATAMGSPKSHHTKVLSDISDLPSADDGGTEVGSEPSPKAESMKLQLVRKYIEALVKTASRYKEDALRIGQKDDDKLLPKDFKITVRQQVSQARDQQLLPTLQDLEFSMDEMDSSKTGCPRLHKIKPTPRQRKRMELKSVALERRSQSSASSSPIRQRETQGYSILRQVRPTQNLICQAEEHTATVTDIAVHDTGPIFLTSSIDTYVRLWDLRSLDHDYALVSHTGYCDTTTQHGKASPVLSLAMLTAGKNAAACGTAAGSFTIFCLETGVVLHGLSLADGKAGAIGSLQRMNKNDVVAAGTHCGYICGVDCRMQSEAFCLKAAREHGPITSIVVGDEHGRESWVVSATINGHVTLWDLRFGMAIRTWQLNEPIHKLSLNGPDPVVLIGTSEVQRWSLESLRQVASYKTSNTEPLPGATAEGYSGVVDAVSAHKGHSIRAICGSRDATWFTTGGTDRKIRYWDSENIGKSYVVSGMDPGQPPYKYTSSTVSEVNVVKEESQGEGTIPAQHGLRTPQHQHKDCVTALSMLRPSQGFCSLPVLISASRDGCVKLWQSASSKPPEKN